MNRTKGADVKWKDGDEMTVRLRRLPINVTTMDIWEAFKDEGSLEAIEIFEDRRGNRDGTAKIRFR